MTSRARRATSTGAGPRPPRPSRTRWSAGRRGRDADDLAPGGRTIIVQPFGGYHELQIQFCDHARLGRQPAVPAREHLRLSRRRLPGHLEAAVDARPRAGRPRGLRSARAVRRLRLDRARVRLHGRQARRLRGASERTDAGGSGHGRLPRRALPLRHRRDRSRPTTPDTSTSTATASATAIATWTTSASTSSAPARPGTRASCRAGPGGTVAREPSAGATRRRGRRPADRGAVCRLRRRRGGRARRTIRIPASRPTSCPRSPGSATTTGRRRPIRATASPTIPRRATLGQRLFFDTRALGPPARPRQRRLAGSLGQQRRRRPRQLRELPRAGGRVRRHAQPAPADLARRAVDARARHPTLLESRLRAALQLGRRARLDVAPGASA